LSVILGDSGKFKEFAFLGSEVPIEVALQSIKLGKNRLLLSPIYWH